MNRISVLCRDLRKHLAEILASMGVIMYDEDALDRLMEIVKEEKSLVVNTAARYAESLHRKEIDLDCIKLACNTHTLLQPPVRQSIADNARMMNYRNEVWPHDVDLRVHISEAAKFRAGIILDADAYRRKVQDMVASPQESPVHAESDEPKVIAVALRGHHGQQLKQETRNQNAASVPGVFEQ